ncbi:MAG: hypothetical protein WD690_02870, partial [Vicinamibacterales bacterium]
MKLARAAFLVLPLLLTAALSASTSARAPHSELRRDRAGAAFGSVGGQAPRVTTPKEQFGFNFGDDYQLTTYQQLADYWRKL